MLERSPAVRYVLITPARNEAAFLGATVASVIGQRNRPLRWVIVSDGSTDGTDEIVRAAMAEHDWIDLIGMPEHRDRNFAAKVACFQAGYDTVRDLEFEVIGNLDADITFDSDYFSFLMEQFAGNPRLGVAGTPFREGTQQYDYRFTSQEHVSGAVQLFRRECFVDIGGYVPIRGGGVDLVAVTTARMRGWQTRSFAETYCVHHRRMGTSTSGPLASSFRFGQKDYLLGWHPVWEVVRAVYQTSKPPYVVGGLLLLAGYLRASLRQVERPVSPEFVRFVRCEQMARLRRFIIGLARPKASSSNSAPAQLSDRARAEPTASSQR